MSASSRPRRTKANLHPGQIILDQKTPRRSSAEVAKERAAVEAQRQALLKQKEDAMKALADLEAKLLEDQKRIQEGTGRPSSVEPTQHTASTASSAPSAQPAPSAPKAKVTPGQARASTTKKVGADARPRTAGSGRSVASEDTPSPRTVDAQVAANKNGPQPTKRLQKLTRAEFEAYRDARKTETTLQKGNVERVAAAGRKRRAADDLLDSTGGDGDSSPHTMITTPAAKKGKLAPGAPSPGQNDPQPLPTSAPSRAVSTQPRSASPVDHTTSDKPTNNTPATTEPELQQDVGIEEQYGGYGEDETDEQLMADRNDLKSGQKGERSTAQSLVQMELVDVAKLAAPDSAVKKSDVNDNHQADDDSTSNQSLKALQPLLGETIGPSGPWRLYGFNLVGAMRDHAAEVWPGIDIDISPRHTFFDLAKQKVSDYRTAMGTEALHAVSKFMLSRRFAGPDDRKEWVQWALNPKTFPFRYERVENTDKGEKKYGIYQNKLILYTLGYHIKRIQLPANMIRDHPCNALALATTAVERALRTWETGEHKKPRGEAGKFSDKNWGRSANEYLASINNISDEKWDKILAKAEQYARGLVDDSDDNESEYGDYDAGDIPAGSRSRDGRGLRRRRRRH
ncbi:hypothetical protein C8T65DRAFT_696547 [Cerioporus squamosus]|nr:hypothetical protein C8T65DRAFT_696547 [Cerioporus squamosus]